MVSRGALEKVKSLSVGEDMPVQKKGRHYSCLRDSEQQADLHSCMTGAW